MSTQGHDITYLLIAVHQADIRRQADEAHLARQVRRGALPIPLLSYIVARFRAPYHEGQGSCEPSSA
jgi:hypothetical protein